MQMRPSFIHRTCCIFRVDSSCIPAAAGTGKQIGSTLRDSSVENVVLRSTRATGTHA